MNTPEEVGKKRGQISKSEKTVLMTRRQTPLSQRRYGEVEVEGYGENDIRVSDIKEYIEELTEGNWSKLRTPDAWHGETEQKRSREPCIISFTALSEFAAA